MGVTLDQNIAWKTTLPELGQSSVTVWDDRVYFSINKPVRGGHCFGQGYSWLTAAQRDRWIHHLEARDSGYLPTEDRQ